MRRPSSDGSADHPSFVFALRQIGCRRSNQTWHSLDKQIPVAAPDSAAGRTCSDAATRIERFAIDYNGGIAWRVILLAPSDG